MYCPFHPIRFSTSRVQHVPHHLMLSKATYGGGMTFTTLVLSPDGRHACILPNAQPQNRTPQLTEGPGRDLLYEVTFCSRDSMVRGACLNATRVYLHKQSVHTDTGQDTEPSPPHVHVASSTVGIHTMLRNHYLHSWGVTQRGPGRDLFLNVSEHPSQSQLR